MNEICVTVAVVNFYPSIGDSSRNLSRIIAYSEAAAFRGARVIVFPELALTGYADANVGMNLSELAETVPGKSCNEVVRAAQNFNMYIIFGMPVRRNGQIYNSIVICSPNGIEAVYDKLHLTSHDSAWAIQGELLPPIIHTPYGKIMAVTGYDLIYYPEVCRYGKAKGSKLLIGASALEDRGMGEEWQKILERRVGLNTLHIAIANLTGNDKILKFSGGSHILSPAEPIEQTFVSAGYTFHTSEAAESGLYMAAIDMTADDLMPHYPYFEHNYKVGTPDWRPDIYQEITEDILTHTVMN